MFFWAWERDHLKKEKKKEKKVLFAAFQ